MPVMLACASRRVPLNRRYKHASGDVRYREGKIIINILMVQASTLGPKKAQA